MKESKQLFQIYWMDSINHLLQHDAYFSRPMAGRPRPLPDSVAPSCIYFKEVQHVSPEFSIVMPIYNQEAIIRKNLSAITRFTHGAYEMILILDACSDNTESEVFLWLEEGMRPTETGTCCRTIVIKSATPLFECAADNVGFAVARAPYLLEIQADMEMSEPGYNLLLKRPFEVRSDVLGVSGRCCHDLFGDRCIGRAGMLINAPIDPSLSNKCFYVNETCNRGPLLLDHTKLKQLGYLDEQNFFLDNSDHDLFARAFVYYRWICGYVPIDFHAPLEDGSTRKPRDPLNTRVLAQRKARSNGGFYNTYLSCHRPREPFQVNL